MGLDTAGVSRAEQRRGEQRGSGESGGCVVEESVLGDLMCS